MIRDIEVRNSIAKKTFLVLSISSQIWMKLYNTKKMQRRGVV
jgi:hypothetical protein